MKVNPWINEVLLLGLAQRGQKKSEYLHLPLDLQSTKQTLIAAVIAHGGEMLLTQLPGLVRKEPQPHPIWLILENARTPFELLENAHELYPYLNDERGIRWAKTSPQSVTIQHHTDTDRPVARCHNLLAMGFLATLLEGVGCEGVQIEAPGGAFFRDGEWTPPPAGTLDGIEVRWNRVGVRPPLRGLKSLLAPGVLVPLSRTDVGRLRDLIRDDPSAGWTVKRAAQTMSVARRTFQRRLAETGQTFSEILWDTRFEVAASMLRNSNRTIAEIAYEAGYSDGSHLARHVRDREGCAPLELREREHA